jgi:hypothetical protein
LYALEANQGWFDAHDVEAGHHADICLDGESATRRASGGGRKATTGWR